MTVTRGSDDRSAARGDVVLLRTLFGLLRVRRWAVPAIVALGVCAALAEGVGLSLFLPLLQEAGGRAASDGWWARRLSSLFAEVPPDDRLAVIAGCILAVIVLRAALGYGTAAVLAWLEARVGHRLRSELFEQLLTIGYDHFERLGHGRLINAMGTETWRTVDAVGLAVNLMTSVCTAIVYVALLVVLSPLLTVAVAVAMLVISLVVHLMTTHVRAQGREVTAANEVLGTRMYEGITGMAVIRTFNREHDEKLRFDATSRRVSERMLSVALRYAGVAPIYEVLSALLLVGVVLVSQDSPGTLPVLLVFVFVLYRLQPRISALERTRAELRGFGGAVEEITALLDRTNTPCATGGTQRVQAVRSGVQLRGVTFRYGTNDRPALDDVSFDIPARCTTALVGPSGAGKSTVIKLLLRLYDPDVGEVLVDNQPLRDVTLESWRERIALVSQDLYLFNASLRDNIAYGRPAASDDDVAYAARLAHADEFIQRLSAGYDTVVGDRGVRLSGGQRQRLALARAIIRDPDVLVLDEATNALDSRSERLVRDALTEFTRDRTVVVVAHRFSTIDTADHVVVLDHGRVSQQGDWQTLMERDGLFRQLRALQHEVSDR